MTTSDACDQLTFHDTLVVSDDLSGAAESAAALLPGHDDGTIALADAHYSACYAQTAHSGSRSLLAVDLDSRHASADEAGRAVERVLRAHASSRCRVFIKIDSLLRGNVSAVLRAAHPVVLAPALPSGGRTVINGVPRLHDVPLHESGAWAAERASAPHAVADALAPEPSRSIPLREIRSARLRTSLLNCLEAGEIPVCDGETDADLDAVAATADGLDDVRIAGSGDLAAAVGRSLPQRRPTAPPKSTGRCTLIVVGTAARQAREQVRRLAAVGADQVVLDTSAPITDQRQPERIARALDAGPVVLTIEHPDGVQPSRSAEFAQRLATTARQAVEAARAPVDLVLTGGETARRTLDALDVRTLVPLTQVQHGAVHNRTPNGRAVVTRPGGFGDVDSLLRITRQLRSTTGDRT